MNATSLDLTVDDVRVVRRTLTVVLFALLLLIVTSCAAAPMAPSDDGEHPHDVHSYAEPNAAYVKHIVLDLAADFTTRRLTGTAELTYVADDEAPEIVLDVRGLEVNAVTTRDGTPLDYALGDARDLLGAPLRVELPEDRSPIMLHYATGADAEALQWLEPHQTSSGVHPFLFTQGQSIYTRTWIPTQDSPGIRQTYEATITVPAGLTAVMSAEMLTPEGLPVDGGTAYRFRLDEPIPPYLIALAVGELEFRPVGSRTGVWAEPSVVDDAAYEFADMPEMLAVAEELYGPYRWGRFDVLVLPPSFPFGGMENPRLTFATPTILAGDRSLVSVIAHELAHSWSGNLVTNAMWEDFWLNEGFTTYIEYRIMEAVYGADFAQMLEQLGLETLREELERYGHDSPDTRLKIDLSDRDPEAGPTYVPYKKGAAFLRAIELAVGRTRFDAFLRRYFDTFAFRPMTTELFLSFLDAELIRGDEELRERIDPDAWVHEPGLPHNLPEISAAPFESVERQAMEFLAGGPATALETATWSTHEWRHFINLLPGDLPLERTRELDVAFGLSDTRNSEIRFSWLGHAIRSGYADAIPSIEEFLTSQGRARFVVPLLRELGATDWGADDAHRILEAAQEGYHPLTLRAAETALGSG